MAGIPVEFTVNVTLASTGENLRGLFKAKPRLSHRDTLMQDQMRRDLLGPKGDEAGPGAIASAAVFSKIWAHLVDAPSWWTSAGNGIDLVDEEPVVAVYDEIVRIEKEAIEAVKKEGAKLAEEMRKE